MKLEIIVISLALMLAAGSTFSFDSIKSMDELCLDKIKSLIHCELDDDMRCYRSDLLILKHGGYIELKDDEINKVFPGWNYKWPESFRDEDQIDPDFWYYIYDQNINKSCQILERIETFIDAK